MELTISTDSDEGVTEETINEVLKIAKGNKGESLDHLKQTWILYAVTRYTPRAMSYSNGRDKIGIPIESIHKYVIAQEEAPFLDIESDTEREEIRDILEDLENNRRIVHKSELWRVSDYTSK